MRNTHGLPLPPDECRRIQGPCPSVALEPVTVEVHDGDTWPVK